MQVCKRKQGNIDFALVGSEKPIIDGIRDLVEKQTGIPVICPKQEYAIEESKVKQRLLFQEIAPEANPRFKIFNPNDYKGKDEVKKDVYKWLDELDNQAVVKPDKPAAGKGVGVWGDHFTTREELFEYFSIKLPVRLSDNRGKSRWRRIQLHGFLRRKTLYSVT